MRPAAEDMLDFSGQPIAVTVNRLLLLQLVNAGINLNLQSTSTVERVIGTAFPDSLTGNSLGYADGRGGRR